MRWFALALAGLLAACAEAKGGPDEARRQAAEAAAAGEAEPHDRSAFASSGEVHVASPDESDMHPAATP